MTSSRWDRACDLPGRAGVVRSESLAGGTYQTPGRYTLQYLRNARGCSDRFHGRAVHRSCGALHVACARHARSGIRHLVETQVGGFCEQCGKERFSIFGGFATVQMREMPTDVDLLVDLDQ